MSVALISKKEWQTLFNTLFFEHSGYGNNGRLNFIKQGRDREMYKSDEDYLKVKIASFVKRLSYSNQITFIAQYHEDKYEIEHLELQDPSLSTLNPKKLFELLGMIEYNCVDNNGYSYLAADLFETINRIQIQLAYVMKESINDEIALEVMRGR